MLEFGGIDRFIIHDSSKVGDQWSSWILFDEKKLHNIEHPSVWCVISNTIRLSPTIVLLASSFGALVSPIIYIVKPRLKRRLVCILGCLDYAGNSRRGVIILNDTHNEIIHDLFTKIHCAVTACIGAIFMYFIH